MGGIGHTSAQREKERMSKEWGDTGKYLKIRHTIDPATMEGQEVFRFDDVDGREYMWDETELYRLIPLKGKFGRPKTKTED